MIEERIKILIVTDKNISARTSYELKKVIERLDENKYLVEYSNTDIDKNKKAEKKHISIGKKISEFLPLIVFATTPKSWIKTSILKIVKRRKFKLVFRVDQQSYNWLTGKKWFLRPFIGKLLKQTDTILTLSYHDIQGIQDSFSAVIDNFVCIPGIIDYTQIAELASGQTVEELNIEQPKIVSCGSLEKNYGFDILLKAYAEINSEIKCKVFIIGEGKEKENLEKLAEKNGISSDVNFLGARDNIYKYISKADLFVVPARKMGFPYLSLEGAICETPIITSDRPEGIEEIFTPGLDAILYNGEDINMLADSMKEVLTSKFMRDNLKSAALSTSNQYREKNLTEAFENVIVSHLPKRYKKRIIFLINTLSGGGAENQLRYVIEDISKELFDVELVLFRESERDGELVNYDIVPYYLNITSKSFISPIVGFYKFIRHIFKKNPDLIVSFMWRSNLLALVASLITGKKILISERAVTDYIFSEHNKIWPALIRLLYKKADLITAVSDDVKDSLIYNFSLNEKKIAVIHNGIDYEHIIEKSTEYKVNESDYILSCGRFVYQKGFDILVESLIGLQKKLIILGEGPLKEQIVDLAKKYRIEIITPGYVDNPYPYFKSAQLFLLTSRYEGMSNSVLEAMACGCPVISTDCPGGMSDIIKNRENGLLAQVDDIDSVRNATIELINSSELRLNIIKNGFETVKLFSRYKMSKSYETILTKL